MKEKEHRKEHEPPASGNPDSSSEDAKKGRHSDASNKTAAQEGEKSNDSFALPEQEMDIGSDSPHYEEPTWSAPSFVVSSYAPSAGSQASQPSTPIPRSFPADPYAETYHANSATQSFLHDTYYPHLYFQDWHETQYDETDRAQDYYQGEAYRDQNEYRQQDYYRYQDYYTDHSAYVQPFGVPQHTPSSAPLTGNAFAPSAFAATGIMFAGEGYSHFLASHEFLADAPVVASLTWDDAQSQVAAAEPVYPHASIANEEPAYTSLYEQQEDHPQGSVGVSVQDSLPSVAPLTSAEEYALPHLDSGDYYLHQGTPDLRQADIYSPEMLAASFAERSHVYDQVQENAPGFVSTSGTAQAHLPSEQTRNASHGAEQGAGAAFAYPEAALQSEEGRAPFAFEADSTSRLTINRQDDSPVQPAVFEHYQSAAYSPEALAASLTESAPAREQVILEEPRAEDPTTAFPSSPPLPCQSGEDPFPYRQDESLENRLIVNRQAESSMPFYEERLAQSAVTPEADSSTRLIINRQEDISSQVPTESAEARYGILAGAMASDHVNQPAAASEELLPNRLTVSRDSEPSASFSDEQAIRLIAHQEESLSSRLTVNPEEEQATRLIVNRENEPNVLNGDEQAVRLTINRQEPVFAEDMLPLESEASVEAVLSASAEKPDAIYGESGSSWDDAPFILFAPTEDQLKAVEEAAAHLSWTERGADDGSIFMASYGAASLLVRDKGVGAIDGRYDWFLVGGEDATSECLVKGSSDSFMGAQSDLLLQAQRRGLLFDDDCSPEVQLLDGPSAFRTTGDALESDVFLPDVSSKGLIADSRSTDQVLSGEKSTDASALIGGGKDRSLSREHAAIAGAAALGVLGYAGGATARVAKAGVGNVLHGASKIFSVAAREDEDMQKVDEARTVLTDAVAKERVQHSKRKARDFKHLMRRELVIKETAAALDRSEAAASLAPETTLETAGVRESIVTIDDKLAEAGVRDLTSVADKAEQLTAAKSAEKVLGTKEGAVGKKAIGESKKAGKAELLEKKEAEAFLLESKAERDAKKAKGEKNEAKPKIGEKLSAKRKKLKDKGLSDGDILLKADAVALTAIVPANAAKRSVKFAGGATKNIAASSALKVLAKENEGVATLLDITDNAKKSVGAVKGIARIPVKTVQTVRGLVNLIKNIGKAIYHTVASFLSLGWPAVLLALFLVIGAVIAVVSNLVIINDKQELSETTALVAELDDLLEAKIHSYGHANDSDGRLVPIYYADARGTYYGEGEDGKSLLMDLDMRNSTCKLETVDASTVEVFTNPDEIIAYIDAKYTGEWQVGAASWKVTVEIKGRTFNIIDWEHVPAWVQSALNKADKQWFKYQAADAVSAFLQEEFPNLTEDENYIISTAAAEELANVIFDQQMQGINDEIIFEAIRAGVGEYKEYVNLSDDQLNELNGKISDVVTELVGEQDPRALVYDEIVALHGYLNWWSEDYEHIDVTQTAGGGTGTGATGSSSEAGTNNAYGYPNASGYDTAELEKWDGYNEVSVYGISESGTTSVTGDGTRITNDWNDTNMAIACEGKQNALFAYWTGDYKRLHGDSSQPVRITLYNPASGATVTAEVRDCGGWRGFTNPKYEGMNATRQWDLLPAVWLALGGTRSSGLMNVYWKVDNEAAVSGEGGGVAAPAAAVEVDYPWPAETDKGDGIISINRATYIRHNIQDLVRCEQLLSQMIGPENYASYSEFKAVYDFVASKLRDIMAPVLTRESVKGDSYTDYMMTRRELGNPFGTYGGGKQVEWVVADQFAPGFQDSFDEDKISVGIKPLNGGWSVHSIADGVVRKVGDGTIKIAREIAAGNYEIIEYGNVRDIQVSEGDEVKRGAHLGSVADRTKPLMVSWYEEKLDAGGVSLDPDEMGFSQRGWAYNPALFMTGFAGYEEPEKPTIYAGGSARDLKDCTTIVDFAYSRLGCPYVWGATGPSTFDCSGLTQWCYAQAGIQIPRTSEAQHDAAAAAGNLLALDESKLLPGDILWKKGHVGIYVGNNTYIHAPKPGDVVRVATGISYFTHALRFS